MGLDWAAPELRPGRSVAEIHTHENTNACGRTHKRELERDELRLHVIGLSLAVFGPSSFGVVVVVVAVAVANDDDETNSSHCLCLMTPIRESRHGLANGDRFTLLLERRLSEPCR